MTEPSGKWNPKAIGAGFLTALGVSTVIGGFVGVFTGIVVGMMGGAETAGAASGGEGMAAALAPLWQYAWFCWALVAASALGDFFGGVVTAFVAKGSELWNAAALGGVLVLFSITCSSLMPAQGQPGWVLVASVALELPMTLAGARLLMLIRGKAPAEAGA